jgi:hypothetical protein
MIFVLFTSWWEHNFLWGRGQLPFPDLSLPTTPVPPLQLKFSLSKNIVKTKISLHSSSIQRNRSIFFVVLVIFCYYVAVFQFYCHFHLIWEDWLKICPRPLFPWFWRNCATSSRPKKSLVWLYCTSVHDASSFQPSILPTTWKWKLVSWTHFRFIRSWKLEFPKILVLVVRKWSFQDITTFPSVLSRWTLKTNKPNFDNAFCP